MTKKQVFNFFIFIMNININLTKRQRFFVIIGAIYVKYEAIINNISIWRFSPLHDLNRKLSDSFGEVNNLVKTDYWGYADRVTSIAKRLLKVFALKDPDMAPQLEKLMPPVIASWGMFNLVSSLQTGSSFSNTILRWRDSSVTRDVEEVAFSTLSLFVSAVDGLDTLGNAARSLNLLGVIPKSAFLSRVGLPVAIVLLSYVSLREFYLVIRRGLFLYNLERKLTVENRVKLSTMFHDMDLSKEDKESINDLKSTIKQLKGNNENDKNIKVIQEKITMIENRQKNRVARKTDAKIVNIMKNLQDDLDQNNDGDVNKGLRDIRTIMKRQITIGVLNTLANVTLTITLIAASALSAVFIQSAFVARTSLFLARDIYKNVRMYSSGLELEQKYLSPAISTGILANDKSHIHLIDDTP